MRPLVYHGMKLSNELTLIKHAHSNSLTIASHIYLIKTLDRLENGFVAP